MKRKPRCRGGEETGECAAELEVMVMVMLVVVITMFCSSSASLTLPLSLSLSLSLFLSLSLTRTHTHTLSLSISSPSLRLPLGEELRREKKKNPPTTHQKPSFNLATAIASLDDIMLTSPRGCVWRCVLGGDNTRVEKGADSRKITNSVES